MASLPGCLVTGRTTLLSGRRLENSKVGEPWMQRMTKEMNLVERHRM